MKEWIETKLYSELIQMPLWTVSAFGGFSEGQSLQADDIRIQLIRYLVMNHMNTIPNELYDSEYRHTWKTSDFLPCIKAAVKRCIDSPP